VLEPSGPAPPRQASRADGALHTQLSTLDALAARPYSSGILPVSRVSGIVTYTASDAATQAVTYQ